MNIHQKRMKIHHFLGQNKSFPEFPDQYYHYFFSVYCKWFLTKIQIFWIDPRDAKYDFKCRKMHFKLNRKTCIFIYIYICKFLEKKNLLPDFSDWFCDSIPNFQEHIKIVINTPKIEKVTGKFCKTANRSLCNSWDQIQKKNLNQSR